MGVYSKCDVIILTLTDASISKPSMSNPEILSNAPQATVAGRLTSAFFESRTFLSYSIHP